MKQETNMLDIAYNTLIEAILADRDMIEADYNRVAWRIGWVLSIDDEYYINWEDLVLIHEQEISIEQFIERHEATIKSKFTTPMYHYFVLGKKEY